MMRTFRILAFLALLAGCSNTPRQEGGDIFVAGDSVMAWNRASDRDIGSVVKATLGRDVVSRATIGAVIRTGRFSTFGTLGIPNQLSPGPWNWIVMNGGANDLGFTCGCARCDTTVDLLISQDGKSGAIPDLVANAKRQSAHVLWVGYYETPGSRLFKGCRPALVEVERRFALHASRTAGVYFVDAEAVVHPSRPELFASDKTHPSLEGSALIGRLVARTILEQSRN